MTSKPLTTTAPSCVSALLEEKYIYARSRYAPSQWETSLLCNDVAHWLGAYLDRSLHDGAVGIGDLCDMHLCKRPSYLFHGNRYTLRRRHYNETAPSLGPLSWCPILNSSPSGQNWRHFADDIFRCILWMNFFLFWLEFHWRLFPGVQLIRIQHWFR